MSEKKRMSKLITLILAFVVLSGCTAIGFVADGIAGRNNQAQSASAYSEVRSNHRVNYGLTMTMLGYEIDKAIIGALEKGSKDKKVKLECRKISRVVEEYVELTVTPKVQSIERESRNNG